MKILKQGNPESKKKQPFWIGLQLECQCGTILELEEGDSVHTSSERTPNGKTTVVTTCPTCGQAVQKQVGCYQPEFT